MAGPAIGPITTNLSNYPGAEVPRFEKLEITFSVSTSAQNLQLPYDPSPPPGVVPGTGVSVDALFTPDDWTTVYVQPAFHFQDFEWQVKSADDWIYPTASFSWKVRFAPDRAGAWQFRIRARDASGTSESAPRSFSVAPSPQHGFIRVSQRDVRYFEHDDGTYFPGLGYNMNYDHVDWTNPVQGNLENFQKMSENGVQLVRIWLSQWSIYGSNWAPWDAINQRPSYMPHPSFSFDEQYPGSEVSMKIFWDGDAQDRGRPCLALGVWKTNPAVKRDTRYRIRVRYKTANLAGPEVAGNPFGLVAKTGGWLWDGQECYLPGTGTVVSAYQGRDTPEWSILEGWWDSGGNDFLPNLYLTLENVTSGQAYLDYVWIEEELDGGAYGPNIVSKPWMAQHLYFDQRNSFAFDRVLELAERYDVYLRPVVMEKNEWISNHFDFQGNPILYDPLCWDSDPRNDPERCPGEDWFYGDFRNETKIRWLQRAWWRYLQARWGYSTRIHSWELLNEGNPVKTRHYALADEFGKYMHGFAPNGHLVSTSFWVYFPRDQFWANPSYPQVDFADYHRYVLESDPASYFDDSAMATYSVSMSRGARQAGGAGKPVIRGEVGWAFEGEDLFAQNASDGLWLHNLIWGSVNSGGMIDSYWNDIPHIYRRAKNGAYTFDHRPRFKPFRNFLRDIPLNNGAYREAAAAVSNPALRAWGQKDRRNGRAHLWLQNSAHTWRNVVEGAAVPPVSGTVEVTGFRPERTYTIEWWDTREGDPARQITGTGTAVADAFGSIEVHVRELATDVALKIRPHRARRRQGRVPRGAALPRD